MPRMPKPVISTSKDSKITFEQIPGDRDILITVESRNPGVIQGFRARFNHLDITRLEQFFDLSEAYTDELDGG